MSEIILPKVGDKYFYETRSLENTMRSWSESKTLEVIDVYNGIIFVSLKCSGNSGIIYEHRVFSPKLFWNAVEKFDKIE